MFRDFRSGCFIQNDDGIRYLKPEKVGYFTCCAQEYFPSYDVSHDLVLFVTDDSKDQVVVPFYRRNSRTVFSIQAQEVRATLGGKVTDAQGAAVSNVAVTLTAEDTNVGQHTRTNNGGSWSVQFLNPGRYRLTMTAGGFKTFRNTAIELQAADVKQIERFNGDQLQHFPCLHSILKKLFRRI